MIYYNNDLTTQLLNHLTKSELTQGGLKYGPIQENFFSKHITVFISPVWLHKYLCAATWAYVAKATGEIATKTSILCKREVRFWPDIKFQQRPVHAGYIDRQVMANCRKRGNWDILKVCSISQ